MPVGTIEGVKIEFDSHAGQHFWLPTEDCADEFGPCVVMRLGDFQQLLESCKREKLQR